MADCVTPEGPGAECSTSVCSSFGVPGLGCFRSPQALTIFDWAIYEKSPKLKELADLLEQMGARYPWLHAPITIAEPVGPAE